MAKDEKFVESFRQSTGKLRHVLGPADQSDGDSDEMPRAEESARRSREQLSELEQHTDSEGHHYAVEKDQPGQAP